jgi:hypothetical protein
MLRFLAFTLLCCGFAAAQSPLTPPFGLRWGDSPETFLSWAEKHSLDITITLPAAEPGLRILRASSAKGPLPGSVASALEGRFLKGRLFEITEHHADASLPTELFVARLEETRKRLTHEYGALLANRMERKVEDQIVTSTRAFHLEPVKGLILMLISTELEDLLRKSKSSRFSIIYRNENLRKDIMTQGP